MHTKFACIALALAAMAISGGCKRDDGDLGHHHHDHAHQQHEAHSHEAHDHEGHDHEGHDHEGHDHEGHDHEGHNHEGETAKRAEGEHKSGEIVLEPDMAAKFGVSTRQAQPGDFCEVINVAGQIVDTPSSSAIVSAPTSGIVRFATEAGKEVSRGAAIATVSAEGVTGGDANKAALAAYQAAKAEYERIKPLYDERLVTAKTYQDALQAYEQAKAAYSSGAATGRALATASGVVTQLLASEGQYVNVGDPIASISSTRRLTLRADLPERYFKSLPSISNAKIKMPHGGPAVTLSDLGGKRESSAAAASAIRGYLPIYFSFNNNGEVMPGAYVEVSLLGAPRHGVISLPVAALSEQQGAYFVFEKLDDECYRKLPVKVGASDGENVEIVSGLKGGEQIVVEGAIAVRLAESSGVVPEGHSHNH